MPLVCHPSPPSHAIENACSCHACHTWCHHNGSGRRSTHWAVPQQWHGQAGTWCEGEEDQGEGKREPRDRKEPGQGQDKGGLSRKQRRLNERGWERTQNPCTAAGTVHERGLKAKGGWCRTGGRRKGEGKNKKEKGEKKNKGW